MGQTQVIAFNSDKFLRRIYSMRLMIALSAFFYSLLIGAVYRSISSYFSEVQGFSYVQSHLAVSIVASIVATIPVVYLPIRSARVSSSILWLIFYTFYVPAIVLPQYVLHRDTYDLIKWIILLWVGFSITCVGHYLPIRKLKRIDLGYRGYFMFLVLAWVGFICVVYINFGMKLSFSAINDVYGQRAQFKDELAASGSSVAGYAIILSGYWLAPIMLLSGIYFNKLRLRYGWWLIGLGVFLSAYIYSVAAFKSIALSFVLVLGYARFIKIKGMIGAKVTYSIIALITITWLLSNLPVIDFIAHQLVRRVFLVPGMNASYFYDYFVNGTRQSSLAPPQAVSIYYYGTAGSANAGFLAAGYASMGVLGVLLVGMSGAAVLWITNIVTKGIPIVLAASGLFMQAYALSNSAFGTAMISYGFIFSLITFYLCPFRVEEFPDGGEI